MGQAGSSQDPCMSIETLSTIGGIVIVAFVLGQWYAHEQQTKRELAEACRTSDGPGYCGLGMKCDHHGPPEIAYARQAKRMTDQCIASRTGPDRSCPLGYTKCTHHPAYIWIREGVDYQWQRSWRRGDYWVQKDEWAKELVEAEAIYSGLPAKAVIEPAVVEKSRAVTRPAASHKTSKTKPQPRRPKVDQPPTIVYPPVEQEDRCVFHSVAMNMGGYFLTRCSKRLDHDGDHVVSAGGCLGGTKTIPAGTPTVMGLSDDAVEPTEPLPGDGDRCPACGSADGGVLVTKKGRFGTFLACRRYPTCTFVKGPGEDPIEPLPGEGDACPKCGETTGAGLTTRRARRTGNLFLGCTAYPRCDYVSRPASLAPMSPTRP